MLLPLSTEAPVARDAEAHRALVDLVFRQLRVQRGPSFPRDHGGCTGLVGPAVVALDRTYTFLPNFRLHGREMDELMWFKRRSMVVPVAEDDPAFYEDRELSYARAVRGPVHLLLSVAAPLPPIFCVTIAVPNFWFFSVYRTIAMHRDTLRATLCRIWRHAFCSFEHLGSVRYPLVCAPGCTDDFLPVVSGPRMTADTRFTGATTTVRFQSIAEQLRCEIREAWAETLVDLRVRGDRAPGNFFRMMKLSIPSEDHAWSPGIFDAFAGVLRRRIRELERIKLPVVPGALQDMPIGIAAHFLRQNITDVGILHPCAASAVEKGHFSTSGSSSPSSQPGCGAIVDRSVVLHSTLVLQREGINANVPWTDAASEHIMRLEEDNDDD